MLRANPRCPRDGFPVRAPNEPENDPGRPSLDAAKKQWERVQLPPSMMIPVDDLSHALDVEGKVLGKGACLFLYAAEGAHAGRVMYILLNEKRWRLQVLPRHQTKLKGTTYLEDNVLVVCGEYLVSFGGAYMKPGVEWESRANSKALYRYHRRSGWTEHQALPGTERCEAAGVAIDDHTVLFACGFQYPGHYLQDALLYNVQKGTMEVLPTALDTPPALAHLFIFRQRRRESLLVIGGYGMGEGAHISDDLKFGGHLGSHLIPISSNKYFSVELARCRVKMSPALRELRFDETQFGRSFGPHSLMGITFRCHRRYGIAEAPNNVCLVDGLFLRRSATRFQIFRGDSRAAIGGRSRRASSRGRSKMSGARAFFSYASEALLSTRQGELCSHVESLYGSGVPTGVGFQALLPLVDDLRSSQICASFWSAQELWHRLSLGLSLLTTALR